MLNPETFDVATITPIIATANAMNTIDPNSGTATLTLSIFSKIESTC